MTWSAPNRQKLLRNLDTLEQAVTSLYRMFLGLLMLAIVAGTVFVVIKRPWGAGHQGEWFYFGVAVLLALGWAIGQYVRLGFRQRLAQLPKILEKTEADGAHTWEFRFGSAAPNRSGEAEREQNIGPLSFSQGMQVPVASLPANVQLDGAALRRLQAELDLGVDLDDACAAVQPAYSDWNTLARWAYRKYVTITLEQHRRTESPRRDDA